jgi:hypothetical protein
MMDALKAPERAYRRRSLVLPTVGDQLRGQAFQNRTPAPKVSYHVTTW